MTDKGASSLFPPCEGVDLVGWEAWRSEAPGVEEMTGAEDANAREARRLVDMDVERC